MQHSVGLIGQKALTFHLHRMFQTKYHAIHAYLAPPGLPLVRRFGVFGSPMFTITGGYTETREEANQCNWYADYLQHWKVQTINR